MVSAAEGVICRHRTEIRVVQGGEEETCLECGQIRILPRKMGDPIRLVQRGRIGGKVTMVKPPPLKPGVGMTPEPEIDPEPVAETLEAPAAETVPDPVTEAPPAEASAAAPEKPAKRTYTKRRSDVAGYAESNKEQIIKDYYSMDVIDFLGIHHFSYSTWKPIKEKWGLKPKGHRGGRLKKVKSAPAIEPPAAESPVPATETPVPAAGSHIITVNVPVEIGMPAFPEFDPAWSLLVQLEWLKRYPEVIKLAREK